MVTAAASPAALLLRVELHRDAVHAVTLARWPRPIREHMAEVSAAFRAMHFDALHPVARVNGRRDGALDRLIKAGPAGATLEFRIGREQRLTARGAFERAG